MLDPEGFLLQRHEARARGEKQRQEDVVMTVGTWQVESATPSLKVPLCRPRLSCGSGASTGWGLGSYRPGTRT